MVDVRRLFSIRTAHVFFVNNNSEQLEVLKISHFVSIVNSEDAVTCCRYYIDQSHNVYNGGISNLLTKSRMCVTQISQGLNYKVGFTTPPNFYTFGLSILVF